MYVYTYKLVGGPHDGGRVVMRIGDLIPITIYTSTSGVTHNGTVLWYAVSKGRFIAEYRMNHQGQMEFVGYKTREVKK